MNDKLLRALAGARFRAALEEERPPQVVVAINAYAAINS